jgi:hypothetical protein
LPFVLPTRVLVAPPETYVAGVVLPCSPRAHDPPELAASVPRAPPA